LCFGISNWRLFVCPSACGLCNMSQDNPRTIMFFEEKITLKTTLLVYYPIVTSNALVSCVISPKNKFQMSMTSSIIDVFFFTKANLFCHINSLLMKHAYTLKFKSV
jgi:hypothetical protein